MYVKFTLSYKKEIDLKSNLFSVYPQQTMMFITITGYFQELDNKKQPIRHFNRTYVIVLEGDGYCIQNEQLHISQPSEAQLKQLNQQLNTYSQPSEAQLKRLNQ